MSKKLGINYAPFLGLGTLRPVKQKLMAKLIISKLKRDLVSVSGEGRLRHGPMQGAALACKKQF